MITPDAVSRTRDRAVQATRARNALSCWKVTRPGEVTIDPVTGDSTVETTTVHTGHAHFRTSSRPQLKSRDDVALTVQGPTLCVVADDWPRLLIGDTVECTQALDSTLSGRWWRVIGEPASSYGIHREYPLEEVTP